MHKLGINFDEISDKLDTSIKLMEQSGIRYGELRSVEGKNFVFWSNSEIESFRKTISNSNIKLVAAATPLFKWYPDKDSPEVPHDNFGFNPRLNDREKLTCINRTFEIASRLSIPRLRIFSGLGKAQDPVSAFLKDPLFKSIMKLSDQYRIDVYIENEPVCRIYTKEHMEELFSAQKIPRLKFWLDIANLMVIGQRVDEEFINRVSKNIGYVHIKDFVLHKGQLEYVIVNDGVVPYARIINDINRYAKQEIVYTIETHAKKDKEKYSRKSIENTKEMFNRLRINYE